METDYGQERKQRTWFSVAHPGRGYWLLLVELHVANRIYFGELKKKVFYETKNHDVNVEILEFGGYGQGCRGPICIAAW